MTERLTIFAPASAPGRAGVAILRVSGPAALSTARLVTGSDAPEARKAALRWLVDPASGERIDQALVLWFPGPHSATGEDVLELHHHGAPSVAAALLRILSAVPTLRLAEPGEFSRRGFLNGKLGVAAVEGLADLVAAETEAQRRQAILQMAGAAMGRYDAWRAELLRASAYLEAAIDFAEDEVPHDALWRSFAIVTAVAQEIARHLDDEGRGERLRDGFSVAIVGRPNVGKSSLLNALAARDIAIVSPEPGTTRDILEARLDLGGYPVQIADTAGLREATSAVEREGVRRALHRAAVSDLSLIVLDASEPLEMPGEFTFDDPTRSLIVINKSDIAAAPAAAARFAAAAGPMLSVSARTGQGLAELVDALKARAAASLSDGRHVMITHARHRAALSDTLAALHRLTLHQPVELAAENLRIAVRALGRLTGRVDAEDLLEIIFKEFCIGK